MVKQDTSLLPSEVEKQIVDAILDGTITQEDGLKRRQRMLNEYDQNGTLIWNAGDKFGIEYNDHVLAEKFETLAEAESWALWNYKGSRRGWRVIARRK